jgi:hypothetical protein
MLFVRCIPPFQVIDPGMGDDIIPHLIHYEGYQRVDPASVHQLSAIRPKVEEPIPDSLTLKGPKWPL